MVDAIVLAGGRSSRLGGVPKASLLVDGTSLLERAVAAASVCRRVVVVGERMPGALHTREDPPFGGPAAGLAAGVVALDVDASASGLVRADRLLVLACDMPRSAAAVDVLLAATWPSGAGCDGLVAIDSDARAQPLLALYSASALREAITRDDLDGLSMRELLARLRLREVAVPAGTSDDIDTPADAARLGAAASSSASSPAAPTSAASSPLATTAAPPLPSERTSS